MKKLTLMLLVAVVLVFTGRAFGSSSESISEKVIKSFKETFPQAEKVNWEEFPDRYIVHFEESNIRTIVDYDKDGNYLSSKRYYSETNLPVNIICKLRKKFTDKKVFGVTEIANENSTEYYIKLEDAQDWITVKSDVSGLMEVVEKYQKQQ